MQTKGFNANIQILVLTNLDSCVLVNRTRNATTQFPAQDSSVNLMNAFGQWIRQLRTVDQELDLEIRPGIYFLKDNSGRVRKFVVE